MSDLFVARAFFWPGLCSRRSPKQMSQTGRKREIESNYFLKLFGTEHNEEEAAKQGVDTNKLR